MGSKVGLGSNITQHLSLMTVMNTEHNVPSRRERSLLRKRWHHSSSGNGGGTWLRKCLQVPSSYIARWHMRDSVAHRVSGLPLWLPPQSASVLCSSFPLGELNWQVGKQTGLSCSNLSLEEKLKFILEWRLLQGSHKAPRRTSVYQKLVDQHQQTLLSIRVVFSKQDIWKYAFAST